VKPVAIKRMERYPRGGHFNWLWPWVCDLKLRTVIDCGGHKGNWTLRWFDRVEKIEVFEPNTEILPIFKERTSHIKNMTLYEVALGDKPGTVSMEYETHPGTYHIKEHGGPIEIKTLDSYNFTNVDIIKIDVEGYEVPLLEGAKKTILSNRPWIQIEANKAGERYGRHKKEILKTLSSFGMTRKAKEWPDQIWNFD
jgi:FkbM family methyltransferase